MPDARRILATGLAYGTTSPLMDPERAALVAAFERKHPEAQPS